MLFLVVADQQSARRAYLENILTPLVESEVVVYDETYGTVADLEEYLYPSLFSTASPVIHLKFMLADAAATIDATFLKKLLASPTVFLFEEIALPSPVVTLFKKSGALVHVGEKVTTVKKDADIFVATKALTAPDKKSRWLAYRAALETHAIEAIIGILYWKVRDLATKNPKEKDHYMSLYKELLAAHARAWETGTPLELMIEKVLLNQ